MRVNSIISVGCRVEGSYGPLVANSNPSIKRRVRSRAIGTVIRASDRHKWEVKFDYDHEIKTVPSNGLTLVPTDTGIPVDEISAASNSVTLTVASASASASIASGSASIIPTSASIAPASVLGEEVIEPADEDAINDIEDNDESVGGDEGVGEDEGVESAPNNDFFFTEEDFLRASTEMNDATRHQGIYSDTWKKIKELEGHEEVCQSSADGRVVWKVVPSVTADVFKDIREYEENLFKDRQFGVYKDATEDCDYNKAFWAFWPSSITDDIKKLEDVINEENQARKERYQRPIKIVSSREYVTFIALLLGASVHNGKGESLWHESRGKKRKKCLSGTNDFGVYMKLWRFKEIRQYVASIMEDIEKKETCDWWRFSGWVEKGNRYREHKLYASHILVFDESMSSFIPRCVLFLFCHV